MREWHVAALSPGKFSSTCFEYRQKGQWFRALPSGWRVTGFLQFSQTKDSLRMMNDILMRIRFLISFPIISFSFFSFFEFSSFGDNSRTSNFEELDYFFWVWHEMYYFHIIILLFDADISISDDGRDISVTGDIELHDTIHIDYFEITLIEETIFNDDYFIFIKYDEIMEIDNCLKNQLHKDIIQTKKKCSYNNEMYTHCFICCVCAIWFIFPADPSHNHESREKKGKFHQFKNIQNNMLLHDSMMLCGDERHAREGLRVQKSLPQGEELTKYERLIWDENESYWAQHYLPRVLA